MQTLPHFSKSLAVRYSLLSWSQFVRSSVRVSRELAGGSEGCIPRNPQPTPRQPPGNPQATPSEVRPSEDQTKTKNKLNFVHTDPHDWSERADKERKLK
ncbi:MAG: hypothetical protein PHT07_12430 [Paludibacter sp.]|nr:hypothetical protein [Paludibacter sp.]